MRTLELQDETINIYEGAEVESKELNLNMAIYEDMKKVFDEVTAHRNGYTLDKMLWRHIGAGGRTTKEELGWHLIFETSTSFSGFELAPIFEWYKAHGNGTFNIVITKDEVVFSINLEFYKYEKQ